MNMHTMLREENEDFPEFIAYSRWVAELQEILGSEVDRNGLAFDLFADGASPQEAADEMRAC